MPKTAHGSPSREALAAHLAPLIAAVGPTALGERIGVSRQAIHQWMTGETFPAPAIWKALAAAILPPDSDWRDVFPKRLP